MGHLDTCGCDWECFSGKNYNQRSLCSRVPGGATANLPGRAAAIIIASYLATTKLCQFLPVANFG